MDRTPIKINFTLLAPAIAMTILSGCATMPNMNDPATYAHMDCSQLIQERQAVAENEQAYREAGEFGFFDALGYLAEGAAIGTGETLQAQQLHQANAQSEDLNQQHMAKADAYEQRTELLDKVMVARQCTGVSGA